MKTTDTKTLPMVVYKNPFGDGIKMLRKRINPQSKKFCDFGEGFNGFWRFEWTACGGAAFCLTHKSNGKYELIFAEDPEDPCDWSHIENFKVIKL